MRPPLATVSLTAWRVRWSMRHRLGQVDDVDIIAGAEDVLSHLRVPAVGLMAKVNASFQELAHRIIGQRHGHSPVDPPRARERPPPLVGGRATGRLSGQGPRVRWPAYIGAAWQAQARESEADMPASPLPARPDSADCRRRSTGDPTIADRARHRNSLRLKQREEAPCPNMD